jgi:hypothetical protein
MGEHSLIPSLRRIREVLFSPLSFYTPVVYLKGTIILERRLLFT